MTTSVQVALGERIRDLRRAAGLSQEAFAAAANIDRGYFGLLERGHVNPALVTLARVCVALRIELDELFQGVGLDHAEIRDLPRSTRGRRKFGE